MASDGLVSSVASSATAQPFLGERSRKGFSVWNDSTAILYLLLSSTGAASASNYTVQMAPNDYYEAPYAYSGKVSGVWASANGNARMSEFV